MKNLIYLLLFLLFISCNTSVGPDFETNQNDYNRYLTAEKPKTSSKNFELWNSKIKQDSIQLLSFSNVAAEYKSYFKKTGDIDYLKKAEKALTKAVEIANIGKAGYRRAFATSF